MLRHIPNVYMVYIVFLFSPPVLKLENAKGISNEQLSALTNDLNKMSLDLCGEVSDHLVFRLNEQY